MISFVVPAHDEEELLPATLAAIRAGGQRLPAERGGFEIIVVDDASTDETARVAEMFGARVIPVAFRRISSVRNAGGRVARGDILVFVDADTQITSAVIQAACEALEGIGDRSCVSATSDK